MDKQTLHGKYERGNAVSRFNSSILNYDRIARTFPERSLWSTVASLALAVITYLIGLEYLLPGFKEIISLKPELTSYEDINLLWIPSISSILIALHSCLAFNIFYKLKPFKEKGIVSYLFWILFISFTVGLSGGILDLFENGINAAIWSTTIALTTCLFIGLFFGLFLGIIHETKR